MNSILADFDKFVIDSAKQAIKESFFENSVNPKNILELMDDLSLDWVDGGNWVEFSFCVENFYQSDVIFYSELSKKPNEILPLVTRIGDMERIVSNINKGKMHYVIELSTPLESPKSGEDFWGVIFPIIDRIKKEYDLTPIQYFQHGFVRGIYDDGTKKDLRCHSGSSVFDMNHRKLKTELSKIWKIVLLLDIK